MATIIILIALLIMGSFISFAFVRFFQRKPVQGAVFLVIGLITIVLFYYGVGQGWIPLPETPPSA
ncbi:hypothetical protein [Paenibacillus hamazuiensis]|uniref:hypothetical protein n=1 Tax=Paenibacillus hamazuiensis TaxID=2936508 RepID=UPI00200FB15D|nr:hypothetical protein [Paenibacillus hamazuiensis]